MGIRGSKSIEHLFVIIEKYKSLINFWKAWWSDLGGKSERNFWEKNDPRWQNIK